MIGEIDGFFDRRIAAAHDDAHLHAERVHLGELRVRRHVVGPDPEQPLERLREADARIAAGRVFRLSGPKDVMNDLKKRDKSAVEVTGLVRKSAMTQAQGVPLVINFSVFAGAMS